MHLFLRQTGYYGRPSVGNPAGIRLAAAGLGVSPPLQEGEGTGAAGSPVLKATGGLPWQNPGERDEGSDERAGARGGEGGKRL